MLRTKADVDRHVAEILRKVKSEREKNLKCYNIALMYYKVRDYESAKHFVSMYLLAKEDAPLANKLLGQIYEALGQKERALTAYKTSLEYESNQPDLVLKICELMCETDITLDGDRARYWCERGSEFFPHDPAIFRLKERLLMIGGNANSQAFEQLIYAELKARPSDVNVRIRLLKLYMETNRAKAAYNHAEELENRQTFRNELAWYECFSQVCQAYYDQNPVEVNWEYYVHWVSVLERVASLTLMEVHGASPKSIADCVQAVFNLDQAVYKAANWSTYKEPTSVVEFYKEFLKHMSAQLYLHMATLTLKKAKNEHSYWKEASQSVAPLLFLAMTKPVDLEATWTMGLKINLKKSLNVYRDDAYYRVSQAGYVLLGLAKDNGLQFTEKVTLKTSSNWRERLFQRIFSTRDHRNSMSTSHLVHNPLGEKLFIKLPVHNAPPLSTSELVPVFEKVHAKSLHYLVWLGIEVLRHNNHKLPPDFHTYSFTTLQASSNKLGSVSVESLNRLDIDAFLYLSVFCANANLDEQILNGYHLPERPITLPADISNMLCTLEQMNWWSRACGVYSQNFKNNSDFIEVRQTLQQGIEIVRIIGNHGLDVQLIVKLARTFAERASLKQTDTDALEARANMYWSAAIPLLEKIQHNQAVRSPVKCLFKCPKKDLSAAEVLSLLEEGRYFVACQLMKEEQHERAIEAFKPLRNPHASFNQALIYKKLADVEYGARPPEDKTSEMKSKYIILLTKARECLYTTKERIRLDKHNPLNSSLMQLLEEIESSLARIESDFVQRRDDGLASDTSVSPAGSPVVEAPVNSSQQNGRLSHDYITSTPQRIHGHGDFRHQSNPAEFVEVGQLLQIQALVNQNNKIVDKIDTLYDLMQQLTSRVDGLCEDVRKLKPPEPEDLYIFGEEEDYGEDVLGQYPTNFSASYQPSGATHYYPRGVQGTSTVTYGAPPIPPTTPQYYTPRVEPTLGYQPPIPATLGTPSPMGFYNQNALPFSEGQQLPDFMRPPVLQKIQVPPLNVVITTSDTLPTGPPPIQPPMSVIIPPHHRLGTVPTPVSTSGHVSGPVTTPPAHNFQITMPANANIQPILPETQEEFESDSESNVTAERDPYPDFQPIIPLPDEVTVRTGEEGETVLFENRAKLYRHVDKEWKERGVGMLKILKNESSGKIRILMRREQVLKICANHLLKSDMELTPMKNSSCSYMWVANDFADETVQLEKLCAKFKTPEEALKFRDAFNNAKKTCGASPVKPEGDLKKDGEISKTKKSVESQKEDTGISKTNKSVESQKVNFGGFTFSSTPTVKAPEKVNKTVEEKKETPIPSPFAGFSFTTGKTPEAQKTSEASGAQSTVKAGSVLRQPLLSIPQTTPKPEPTKIQPKSILKESVLQSETPAKTQPFIFSSFTNEKTPKHVLFQESSSESSPAPDKATANKSPTLIGLLTATDSKTPDVVSFASLSGNQDNKNAFSSNTHDKKRFEGAGSTVFGRPKKDSESETADDFVPTAEFKPVIPLPELIEVKTGEEGQDVVFEERCKLFRFDSSTKEWKERGVGKMKILKDPNSGAVRFLMRREQVFKLSCNHRISSNLEMVSHMGSDRAWTWHAQDYAEGEMRNEMFSILFKHSDQAKAFKRSVDQMLEDLKNSPVQSGSPVVSAIPATSSVTSTTPHTTQDTLPISPKNVWKCSCLFPNAIDSPICRACKKPNPKADPAMPKFPDWIRTKLQRWECSNCYTENEFRESVCENCGSEKNSVHKSPQTVFLSDDSSVNPNIEDKLKPSLTDMFKPKPGSWTCSSCYVVNEETEKSCSACQTVKPKEVDKTKESAIPLSEMCKPKPGSWNCPDCFVVNDAVNKNCVACQKLQTETKISKAEEKGKPLAELFKPKAGSWECSGCLVRNDESKTICPACNTPQPGFQPKDEGKPTVFSFKSKAEEKGKSLAELFKPKAGSWECSGCLVRNDESKTICPACNTPQPGHHPKDEGKPTVFSFKSKAEEKGKPLAELFKPKAGSWECSGCLVRNDESKTICPACNTPQPGFQPKDEGKPTVFSFGVSTLNFGIPQTDSKGGFTIEKPSSSKNTGFVFDKSNNYSSFSFGMPTEKKEDGFNFDVAKNNEKPLFNFGIAQTDTKGRGSPTTFGGVTGSLFGVDKQKQNETSFQFGVTKDENKTGELFSFGASGKPEFNFTPKSPGERVSESEPDEVEEDDGDHIHFQPVVPLPDKVDVKTGEENEEMLYSHRSKLYRYMDGEWKERGVGDIKILRNFDTKKIRLLMRREPIMKICLNHYLTEELNFTPKDPRAWLWSAFDFAEEELKVEKFCLRFKTPEIAAEFKEAIDGAQNQLRTADDITKNEADLKTPTNPVVVQKSPESPAMKTFSFSLPSDIFSTTTTVAEKKPMSPGMKAFSFSLSGSSSPTASSFSLSSQFGGLAADTGASPRKKSMFGGTSHTDQGCLQDSKIEPEAEHTDKDLEVVYENDVTLEERESALKLQLPPKFYSYRRAPDCPGCVGCEVDANDDDNTCDKSVTNQTVEPVKVTDERTEATPPAPDTSTTESLPVTKPEISSTDNNQFELSSYGIQSSDSNQAFKFGSFAASADVQAFDYSIAPKIPQSSLHTQLGANTTDSPQLKSIFGGSLGSGTNDNENKNKSLFVKSSLLSESAQNQSPFYGSPVATNETLHNQSLFSEIPVSTSENLKIQSAFSFQLASASETPKSDSTQVYFEGTKVCSPFSSEISKTPTILADNQKSVGATPKKFYKSDNTPDSSEIPKSQSFFGSSAFTKSENTNNNSKSIFGGSPSSVKTDSTAEPYKFSFGNTSKQQFTFGDANQINKSQFTFGASENNSETKSQGLYSGTGLFGLGDSPIFGAKSETSFAQLAAENNSHGFKTSKENFSWGGEKKLVFSKTLNTPSKSEKLNYRENAASSDDEVDPDTSSHDPHFEPIVPLPAAIEVRTGEEEEIREFCHRVKLYRYNNTTKEWKERGVGEMKILKHPVNNTYRLLMRREQVHKVVCNHLLTDNIEMKMMSNSETSLTWGAMNLSDEFDTPQLELLAIKFKTIDLCLEFKAKVEECIKKVVEFRQVSDICSPQAVCSTSMADKVVDDEEEDDEEDDDDDDDDDEEEEEEDEDFEGNDADDINYYDEDDYEVYELLFDQPATMFTRIENDSAWATIGTGNVQIMYDRDILASRIIMKGSDDILVFNSIISPDSQLKMEGKDCIWVAEEDTQVMARFNSDAAAEEFKMNFCDGICFAEKAFT